MTGFGEIKSFFRFSYKMRKTRVSDSAAGYRRQKLSVGVSRVAQGQLGAPTPGKKAEIISFFTKLGG